jgi:hypothetical protein
MPLATGNLARSGGIQEPQAPVKARPISIK